MAGSRKNSQYRSNLKLPSSVSKAGSRAPQTLDSVVAFLTSKSMSNTFPICTHTVSVSLQVAFLNHEYSITRRMSQDLKVSRRNDGHNSRPTTKTMTPPIRSRTSAGLKSRTQSRVLEIPKTPTRSVLSEDEAPNSTTVHGGSKHATNDDVPVAAVPIEPRVRSSAMGTVLQDRTVSKQPSHLDTSNPSHTDDDARRKNSLDDMVSRSPLVRVSELIRRSWNPA